MPTIALTNSIAFANVPDVERDFPRIRVMGTIGWIASGLACGFLPQMLGYADISPTNIPLLITAGSSALLGVFAFFLPDTPPKSTGKMDIKVMPLVWHVVSCRKCWGMPISHRRTSRC